MHCTSCEDIIETVAASTEGLHEAEASYASDMAKVACDPARYAPSDLPALLTQAGYEAHLEAPDEETADQNTAARLVFGGFFAMMVMAVYIVLLYPVHLGGEGLVDLSSTGGLYALANVWAYTTFVLFVTGWPTLRGAAVSLRVRQPNMDLLVGLTAVSAYLYSTGAVLMGQTDVYFDVTVVIIMAVSLGHYYEDQVKRRATDLLSTLTREQVDEARRVTEGDPETVAVDDLAPGDRVLVLAAVAFGWQLWSGASGTAALLTGLAVLIVSCPCALGLATPLTVASGLRTALENGIVVGDTLRDEGLTVMDALRGDERAVVVITGDSAAAARPLRAHDAIDRVIAEVQPAEKSDIIRGLREEQSVAMIGDGSNDAPALAEADVGVAFGPTALAADSADVVVLRGDLTRIPTVFSLARAARRRIRQNLAWAFLYNIVAIPLALVGLINPLFAALAMAASSLGVVGNSARPLPVAEGPAERKGS